MLRVFHRTGQALLAIALALSLLAAPVAWGASPAQGATGWLNQFWDLVTAWIAPVERGPAADPDGLAATSESETTTAEPWQPAPLDPASTDTSTEGDDRGASMDPDG